MGSGYVYVNAPPEYPGITYEFGDRILEHHLVWWWNTGQVVPDGFVVHHKNEIKNDNRFDNLELKEFGVHTRDHLLIEDDKEVECSWCGCKLIRSARDIRSKNSQGQLRFFCCSSHAALMQSEEKVGNPVVHGTYGAYRIGCRCNECKMANSERMARYRSSSK